jgi:ligand-binding sensor domain-containing protein
MHDNSYLILRFASTIIGIVLFFQFAGVRAQGLEWKVQHVSIEDGLSNRFVNTIIQDDRGFAWIGTNFGLNRYDGHHFDILTKESSALQSNTIFGLWLDDNKKIWVIHREVRIADITGIDIIDPVTFEIKTLQEYLTTDLPFSLDDILNITADNDHTIHLITKQKTFYKFDADGLVAVQHSASDYKQFLYHISRTGLYYNPFDYRSEIRHNYNGVFFADYPFPELVGKEYVWPEAAEVYLGEASNGWSVFQEMHYTTKTINFISKDTEGQIQHRQTSPVTIPYKSYTFWDPFRKIVWCHTASAFFTFDPITGASTPVDYPMSEFIKAHYFNDKGMVWLGTEDGIFLFTPKPKYFETHLNSQVTQYSCRGFTEDKAGNIFVMTYGGIFKCRTSDQGIIGCDSIPDVPGVICTTDRLGYRWVVGEWGKLFRVDPKTYTYQTWSNPTDGYFANWSIIESRSGMIVVGTNKGLLTKDPKDTVSQKFFEKFNGFDILKQSTIYHLLETEEGIWASSTNGLFLIDLDKGVLAHYDERSGLSNSNLFYLHIDADGIFWIATRGGGLIRWDRKQNTFKSITTKQGLSHNVIYAILEDRNGFFWMPSDFGLMRYEKETGICRTFLPSDGLPHEEFNRASYFKDSKGYFYFGGLRGFIRFHPDSMRSKEGNSYPLLLTKFELINSNSGSVEDLRSDIAMGGEIRIPPNIRSFIMHYAILDYDDPKLKRYAYKIEGLDNSWNYVSENFIRINGLSGGKYTVRIKMNSFYRSTSCGRF